jgi:hypothetical protein
MPVGGVDRADAAGEADALFFFVQRRQAFLPTVAGFGDEETASGPNARPLGLSRPDGPNGATVAAADDAVDMKPNAPDAVRATIAQAISTRRNPDSSMFSLLFDADR